MYIIIHSYRFVRSVVFLVDAFPFSLDVGWRFRGIFLIHAVSRSEPFWPRCFNDFRSSSRGRRRRGRTVGITRPDIYNWVDRKDSRNYTENVRVRCTYRVLSIFQRRSSIIRHAHVIPSPLTNQKYRSKHRVTSEPFKFPPFIVNNNVFPNGKLLSKISCRR